MKRNVLPLLFSSLFILATTTSFADDLKGGAWLYTQTGESQQAMTADKGLQLLKEGNARFIKGEFKNRDYLSQAKLTSKKGQYPFAIVLNCMDSRGPAEMIFDQGIGDIFSVRLAGNVLDTDQLGSMEYATEAVGSHLIVVMGHTSCGAVAGACSGVELGNLTQLLEKIHPAIDDVKKANKTASLNCQDPKVINDIAKQNVLHVMNEVKNQSPIIAKLVAEGKVKIVGAMHDLRTGEVTFF